LNTEITAKEMAKIATTIITVPEKLRQQSPPARSGTSGIDTSSKLPKKEHVLGYVSLTDIFL